MRRTQDSYTRGFDHHIFYKVGIDYHIYQKLLFILGCPTSFLQLGHLHNHCKGKSLLCNFKFLMQSPHLFDQENRSKCETFLGKQSMEYNCIDEERTRNQYMPTMELERHCFKSSLFSLKGNVAPPSSPKHYPIQLHQMQGPSIFVSSHKKVNIVQFLLHTNGHKE